MTCGAYLEVLVHLVDDGLIEGERVLLLADVDALTPQLEHLPEALRHVVLQLAVEQVREDLLQLVEDTANTQTAACLAGARRRYI